MRAKGQVGQIICTCGRVGELRTRGNGAFLPFLMCKHCGMKQGKEALRDEWLSKEDTSCSLGAYGEFPAGGDEALSQASNQTSKAVKSEQVSTSSKHQVEWQPDEANQTDIVKAEQAATPEETEESSSMSVGAKIGLGIFALVATAFGISRINLTK